MDEQETRIGMSPDAFAELTALAREHSDWAAGLQTQAGHVRMLSDIYLTQFQIEAQAEASPALRIKTSTIAHQRRQTVKQLGQVLGRWPSADDILRSVREADGVGAELRTVLAADLERLKQPQTRRRSGAQKLEEQLAALRKRARPSRREKPGGP